AGAGLGGAVGSGLQPATGRRPAAENGGRAEVRTGGDAERAEELGRKVDEPRATGKYAGAQEPAREILAIRTRGLGATHWQTADAKRDLQTLDRLPAPPRRARAPAARGRPRTTTIGARRGRGEHPHRGPVQHTHR